MRGLPAAVLYLVYLGCASAPPSQTPVPAATAPSAVSEAPAPAPPPVPALPASNLVCGVEGRRIAWADLEVPEGSRPLDVALGRDTVWVLFEPSLLVGVPREDRPPAPAAIPEFGQIEEMGMSIPGPPGSAWSSLDADPWDGSVWIASAAAPRLWLLRPGRRPAAVRLSQAPPAGSGGFLGVAAGQGSVWLAPACAGHALWRLEPSGRVRGTALEQAAGGCEAADLERDWSGSVWALRPVRGELLRLRFDGSWEPADARIAVPAPAPEGRPPVRSWFFWGTEPLGVGDGEDATVLYRRVDGRVAAFREDCGPGNALLEAAGDRRGWAVLTRQWLLLGGYAQEAQGGGSD